MERRDFLRIAAAAASAGTVSGQGKAYTFESEASGKTLKTPSGQTVFTYLTSKPEGVPLAGNSACCFHPLNTPSGERVTDIAPADHKDHRGLFFAWHEMTFHGKDGDVKGDFWGWGRFAPTEGRIIENRVLRLLRADAQTAEIAIQNDWNIQGRKALDESATAKVSERQGARILDLQYRFGSDAGVTLNQMAFTGLCLRCRKDGQAYFSDTKGKVTLPDSNATKPELNWPAADWYSYTIALENGKTIAAAVIDHPANPKSTWHEPTRLAFLNPCIAAPGPSTFPPGSRSLYGTGWWSVTECFQTANSTAFQPSGAEGGRRSSRSDRQNPHRRAADLHPACTMATALSERTISALVVGRAEELESMLPPEASSAVDRAESPADAIVHLARKSYHLVLIDHTDEGDLTEEQLGYMRALQAIRPAAKTIVLVSHTTPRKVIEALRHGVAAYFTRPFDPAAVRDVIAHALSIPNWSDGIELLSAEPDFISVRLRCCSHSADRLAQFMRELPCALPDEERIELSMAFREMLMNAIEHGGKLDPASGSASPGCAQRAPSFTVFTIPVKASPGQISNMPPSRIRLGTQRLTWRSGGGEHAPRRLRDADYEPDGGRSNLQPEGQRGDPR